MKAETHFRMPKAIPDRWEDYQALGEVIEGTRFIAFKVPLKEQLLRGRIQEKDWFSPQTLLETLSSKQHKLGLVIDLTNTNRYYNPQEMTRACVSHEKVRTEGHVVPSKKVISRFFKVVDQFLEENQNSDILIGVHCTHGVNRTGYLVCRYMIDKLGFDPEDALRVFNTARGYDVERQNYIEDLKLGKRELTITDQDECEDEPNTTNQRYRNGYKSSNIPHDRCYNEGSYRDRPCNEWKNDGYYDRKSYKRKWNDYPRQNNYYENGHYYRNPYGYNGYGQSNWQQDRNSQRRWINPRKNHYQPYSNERREDYGDYTQNGYPRSSIGGSYTRFDN